MFDTLIARGRRLHPELPSRHRRPARRRREAAAGAQSEAGVLLDQRLRQRRALRRTGRATTRWRRRCRDFSAWWWMKTGRASSGRRSPMPSPASMPRMACSARCSIAAAPARAAWSKCRCSRRWRISPSSRIAAYFALGTVPRSQDRPRLAQAHILRTGDGGLIAIHLSSLEKFWTGLLTRARCAAAWRPTRVSRPASRASTTTMRWAASSTRCSRSQPTAYWVTALGANDVPFAPINRVDAAVQDPQVKHLGLMVPVDESACGHACGAPAPCSSMASAPTACIAAPLLERARRRDPRAARRRSQAWPAQAEPTYTKGS